jgi:hypothetical protein
MRARAIAVGVALVAGGCTAGALGDEGNNAPVSDPPPATLAIGALPSTTAIIGVAPTSPDSTTAPTVADTTSSITAEPSSTTIADETTAHLVLTGDVLMHSPLWRQALADGGGVLHDFRPMFSHIRPIVFDADLAVCHLETPIAPDGEEYSTSPRYGVPAEVVDSLAAVGFDHCSTASNHTFDRGLAGIDATVARIEAAGMTQHGMARSPEEREPVLVVAGGVTIGLLSATYGFDGASLPDAEPWRSSVIDVDQIISDAASARARGAEVVIASLHWGDANSHVASADQVSIASRLAESRQVDLIVGHHAHVVQPIEQIGTMWVAYGLGNLISNLPVPGPIWTEDTRDGIILDVVVRRSATGEVTVGRPPARPVWVDRDAGWVVRDLLTARTDPDLVGRLEPQLNDSWERTTAVVAAFVRQV